MVITDYLKEDHIWTDFRALDKDEALKALCDLTARLESLDSQEVLKVICDRERRSSTGLGGGVALPHSQTSLVREPVLVLAVSPGGVSYDSIDDQPVHIFVLMLTPADGREHLSLLARLGRLLKSPVVVSEMMNAKTAAQIRQILVQRDY